MSEHFENRKKIDTVEKAMEDTQKHHTGGEIKKARQSSSVGLIIRQKEPANLETPFDQVDSFLTPTELFYIRSHFPVPKWSSRPTNCASMVRSGIRSL